ncbi:MAG: VOC family protein [Bacteroidota bacterium]|nr:VOC family protein [Bacteroidota bacterium]
MKITQIKETCLYVQNLDISQKFYNETLGFPVIGQAENRHAFFRAGTSVLLCFNPEATKNETKLPLHYAFGPQHIAFEVKEHDYQIWLEKIKTEGIKIIHIQEWKNNQSSFYFHDPDGNVLEIIPEGIWE